MNTSPLTTAEKIALQRFVLQHGRRGWKTAMRRLWARAIASTEVEQTLYALRNLPSVGPGWLMRARVDEAGWLK